jgi:hypothetical protein
VFVLVDHSESNFVWSECESDCKQLISVVANDSKNATVTSVVILSTIVTILLLQKLSSEAELGAQDQVERSNAQTITLLIIIHSYIAEACVNLVWMCCVKLAHGLKFGAAVDGQRKGRSWKTKDSKMVDCDGRLEVIPLRCYGWGVESVRSPVLQGALESSNCHRRIWIARKKTCNHQWSKSDSIQLIKELICVGHFCEYSPRSFALGSFPICTCEFILSLKKTLY